MNITFGRIIYRQKGVGKNKSCLDRDQNLCSKNNGRRDQNLRSKNNGNKKERRWEKRKKRSEICGL
jgi:hypothetical protein